MAAKDDEDFKARHHAELRRMMPTAMRAWEETLAFAESDDVRKFVEHATKVLGLEVDRKQEAVAALPVFNFTFINGGVQAQPVAPTVLVQEVAPEEPAPTPAAPELESTPFRPSEAKAKADFAAMEAELDAMLAQVNPC